MKKQIEKIFLGLLLNLGMDKPSNFDEIVDFIYKDISETSDPDNWHSGDVVIAFRRFIESKTEL